MYTSNKALETQHSIQHWKYSIVYTSSPSINAKIQLDNNVALCLILIHNPADTLVDDELFGEDGSCHYFLSFDYYHFRVHFANHN